MYDLCRMKLTCNIGKNSASKVRNNASSSSFPRSATICLKTNPFSCSSRRLSLEPTRYCRESNLLQLWLIFKALLLLIGLFKLRHQPKLFPFRLFKFATQCNAQKYGNKNKVLLYFYIIIQSQLLQRNFGFFNFLFGDSLLGSN